LNKCLPNSHLTNKNLCKSFKTSTESFHALKNINLTIKDGEAIVIYGESGSGKSTLLSIIASIMKPSSGKVLVDEENIVSLSDIHCSDYRKNRVGFITQSFHLFDELTLHDNLLTPLVIQNLTKDEIEEHIDRALNLANIAHKKTQKVKSFSGGERQRSIIARALVNNPDIIICDEPTANLDIDNSLAFIEMLQNLKKESKSIIISSHDELFKTQEFVDRVLYIKDGSLG
jgi:putative ABC transport system ATP-binding protein